METCKSLVVAVEENNRINDAKWSDWESVDFLLSVYGELQTFMLPVAREFLNALIRDNGANLEIYLDAMDCLEYGQPFAR